ncbi:MAG TPA: hypothetical protein VMS12_04825 [Thermoanaerobaculia bacterium]|nr:hypothetical protein [Thermoanaerobaculia bacterium]
MKTLILCTLVVFSAVSVIAAPAKVRRTVVMAQGEKLTLPTRSPVTTISSPQGTNQGMQQVVRYVFQQYDQSVLLDAVRIGEAKLLIEGTDSRIGEVLNVIVTNKDMAARHRNVVGTLAGVVGITSEDVHIAGDLIVVTGEVFSLTDLNRCVALAAQTAAPPARGMARTPHRSPVACLTRMSSAAPAIFPDRGYIPAISLEVEEQIVPLSDANTPGGEGESMWSAVVRLGDVPVLMMDSSERATLIQRVANLAGNLSRASAEWRAAAEKNEVYPTVFQARSSGGRYEISMVWRFDQGTRGESLIQFTPQEVQRASMRAGGASDRLVAWWTALMQDSFRLYYLAQRPSGTLSSSANDPLLPVYESAVRLADGKFERTNSAVAVARGYYALKTATGRDPFEDLLTRPPADFTGAPIGR